MIAKILIYVLLLILIPHVYIYFRYLRRRCQSWWKRLLCFLPAILMIVYTLWLGTLRDFVPDNMTIVNTYLFLLGLLVVPTFVFTLFSSIGWGCQKLFHLRYNIGSAIGIVFISLIWYVLIVGSTCGFESLRVRHVTITSADLPAAFDGYCIVHFSDAHLGSYSPSRHWVVQRAIDSVNAQHADAIVFTGDLQNRQPSEVEPFLPLLSQLKARDGVYSVLGNHDYPTYVQTTDDVKRDNFHRLVGMQQSMDWHLLINDREIIRRGNDSIVIAGMENDGDGKHFPQLGNINHTLRQVSRSSYVVMLQHDPSSWRRKILPHSHAQLTLSGHTHAMQFTLFGWSPVDFIYREWGGLYRLGNRHLYVSTGLGGFIPFRFGVPGEVVVITLRRS